MIETWAFSFLSPEGLFGDELPTPEQFQETYDRYLDLWAKCEEFGLDGIAFAEHHFTLMSLTPSPHLAVAALAARTKNLRFTTLGSVLPLYDARRYVEEVGMLDYLTRGRFEPGIAPGVGDREAGQAGVAADEIRPRYYSGAELLAKAVENPVVTHQDQFSNLEKVPIIPPMRPGTGVPWVTVMSPNSAEWTGRRGYKLCTAFLPTPAATGLADRYRATAEAAGHTVDPAMLGLRRRVFVAATDAEAQEKYEASVDKFTAFGGRRAAEAAGSEIRKRVMHPDDFAIGSPATVAEKMIEQCRAGGYGAIFAFTDFAQFQHEDLVRSHELLGRQVAPVLRSATVDSPATV